MNRIAFAKSDNEPISTKEATKRTVEILDVSCKKGSAHQSYHGSLQTFTYLIQNIHSKLLSLLLSYDELFDGTLGYFQSKPVNLDLKEGTQSYHGRAFPIAFKDNEVFQKEVNRLLKTEALKCQDDSERDCPAFAVPKNDQTVRFLIKFREINKRITPKPFPIPKISFVFQ